jgi:UDP-N-acetyl-D-glucosamine dehydrogenase
VEVTASELARADGVLILTDHPEFDYALVVDAAPLVIDARNATTGLTATADRVVRL